MDGMMDQAKDAAGEVVEKADDAADVADKVTDKIPGEADDKPVEEGKGLIDKAKDMLGGS